VIDPVEHEAEIKAKLVPDTGLAQILRPGPGGQSTNPQQLAHVKSTFRLLPVAPEFDPPE
jgi:hypothetical protein